MDPMVRVENLSKKFKLYKNPWHRALEWAAIGGRSRHEEFWAVKNISFEIGRGECLGIIGQNGAGKTTILRLLTRALYPTSGTFEVRGRVLSLLELGTGFNAELTGRQNLAYTASLFGLDSHYIEKHTGDIEDFSELGAFFDRPVKTYSSGMVVRLAFSMFVFLEPDVLIIDEALSVGDIFFQQKSFAKMRDMISSGLTCLFVTHDLAALQNLCKRAILLNHGESLFQGDASEAVNRYFATLGSKCNNSGGKRKHREITPESPCAMVELDSIFDRSILTGAQNRHGAGGVEITAARVTDDELKDTLQVEMRKALNFHILLHARSNVVNPSAGLHVYDRLGNLVFAAGARHLGKRLPDLSPGDRVVVKIRLTFNVQPGEYTFNLAVSEHLPEHEANIAHTHDRYEMLGPVLVTADSAKMLPFYGIAQLPMSAEYSMVPCNKAEE